MLIICWPKVLVTRLQINRELGPADHPGLPIAFTLQRCWNVVLNGAELRVHRAAAADLHSLFQMWRSQRAPSRSSEQWMQPRVGTLPPACHCLVDILSPSNLTPVLHPRPYFRHQHSKDQTLRTEHMTHAWFSGLFSGCFLRLKYYFLMFACVCRILCRVHVWVHVWFHPSLHPSLLFTFPETFSSGLSSVKSVSDPPSWHQPGSPDRKRAPREVIRGLSLSSAHPSSTPFHQQGYVSTRTHQDKFVSQRKKMSGLNETCVCAFRLSSCRSAAAASTAWRGSSWSWTMRRSWRIWVWPAAQPTSRPAQVRWRRGVTLFRFLETGTTEQNREYDCN